MRLICRNYGDTDYAVMMQAMQRFTATRSEDTGDELWFTEHAPVFTLGRGAKTEHILDARDIPVMRSDRGGQVTYHGPGQLLGYTLFDIKRLGMGIKQFVSACEQSLIDFLAQYGIDGERREGAPGVYIGQKKIAALGLRVRQQGTYHGFSLNINMDLSPFSRINPCGYTGLAVTQLSDHGVNCSLNSAAEAISTQIQHTFGYTEKLILTPSDL